MFQEGLTPSQFDVDVSTQTYTNTVTVRRAELGYFPVLGHETPSAQDKAWLTMLVGLDAAGRPVPPDTAYTFTAADGTATSPRSPSRRSRSRASSTGRPMRRVGGARRPVEGPLTVARRRR